MKKIPANFLSLLFVSTLFLLLTGNCWAATLKFDKSSSSANIGDTFDLQVIVDAGSDQVTSTDAYVVYDTNALEAQSVANGSYFPSVSPQISSGTVYIAGLVEDSASSKTGSGTLATIKFKALANGSTTVKFNCSGTSGPSKIIKSDINTTNIIDCGGNGLSTIAIGGSSSSTQPTSTPGNYPTTTTLPRTGVFDNVAKVAIPGSILLFLGMLVKFLF